jgi:pyruvate carboxylase subunit B
VETAIDKRLGEAEMKYFVKKENDFIPYEVTANDGVLQIRNEHHTHNVKVVPLGNHYYSIVVDNQTYVVNARQNKKEWVLNFQHREAKVQVLDTRQKLEAEMFGSAEAEMAAGDIKAPMPGLILRVEVKVGDVVEAGQPLLVMEAMKMENEIRANVAGTVKEVLVSAQQAVEKDDILIKLG